jgi:hypothetical protein
MRGPKAESAWHLRFVQPHGNQAAGERSLVEFVRRVAPFAFRSFQHAQD